MRRNKTEEHDNHERWLVSYADFMTLLFAFFTVLYATSQQDAKKSKTFEDSIRKYLIRVGAVGDSGQQLNEGQKFDSPIEPPIQSFKSRSVEAQGLKQEVEAYLENEFSSEELSGVFHDINATSQGVRVSVDGVMLFAPGSAKLREVALKIIDRLVPLIRNSGRQVIIEAHSDSLPEGAANFPSNWELAGARASTITRYLLRLHKVEASRLAALSYGDSLPLGRPGEAINSRLDFMFVTSE